MQVLQEHLASGKKEKHFRFRPDDLKTVSSKSPISKEVEGVGGLKHQGHLNQLLTF